MGVQEDPPDPPVDGCHSRTQDLVGETHAVPAALQGAAAQRHAPGRRPRGEVAGGSERVGTRGLASVPTLCGAGMERGCAEGPGGGKCGVGWGELRGMRGGSLGGLAASVLRLHPGGLQKLRPWGSLR